MIDRDRVIAATVAELDARAGQCRPEHSEIGGGVADRLGLRRTPTTAPPGDPLDALGRGVFVRRISDWPVQLLARFDWCCVAVISGRREALNRDAGWYRDAQAAGVAVTVFDWLPSPHNYRAGLRGAVAFAVNVGALCYVVDAEKEWKGAGDEIAAAYMDEIDAGGMPPGFTSYSLPKQHPGIPWRAFLSRSVLSIAQAYDRDHLLAPHYATQAVAGYRERGAGRVVVGRGAHRRDDPATPEREVWRTPAQIVEHRATTPPKAAECWWMPAGQPSGRVVDAIVT